MARKHYEYDIPEWALYYLEYGEAGDLQEEEIEIVKAWVKKNFPNGYYMEIDWDNYIELDFYPAFGTRNPRALVRRGESPYYGVKTYKVNFYVDE